MPNPPPAFAGELVYIPHVLDPIFVECTPEGPTDEPSPRSLSCEGEDMKEWDVLGNMLLDGGLGQGSPQDACGCS